MTTISGYTLNYRFPKFTFASRGWHSDFWAILDSIDGLLASVDDAVPFAVAGGTVDVITLDYTPNVAYTAGLVISFSASGANTGAVTVNCDGLGAKALVGSDGSALIAGDLDTNMYVRAIYDGTRFVCINPARVAFPPYVITASSGATADAEANDFRVENNLNCGISILNPAAYVGRLTFGRPLLPAAGGLKYDHSTDKLTLRANDTDAVEIESDGEFNALLGLKNNGKYMDVVLNSGSHSGASELFIELPAGYRSMTLELLEIIPASLTTLSARFSINGGVAYVATGYDSKYIDHSTATVSGSLTSACYGSVANIPTTADKQNVITFDIDMPLSGAADTRMRTTPRIGAAHGSPYSIDSIAALGARPTHIRIYTGTGNFTCRWRLRSRRD